MWIALREKINETLVYLNDKSCVKDTNRAILKRKNVRIPQFWINFDDDVIEQVIFITHLDRLADKWMEFDLLHELEMLNLTWPLYLSR